MCVLAPALRLFLSPDTLCSRSCMTWGVLRVRSVSGSTHALCPAMLSSPQLRKQLLWSLLARRAQTTCPSLPLHILIFDSPGRTTQWSTAALSPGSSRGSLLSPPKRFAVFDLAYHFRILEFRVFPRHSLCCTPQSLVVAWSLSNTLCLRSWSARWECHLAPLPFRRLIMPLKHALRCAQRITKSRDALPWSTLAKSRLSPMPPSYTQSFRPTLRYRSVQSGSGTLQPRSIVFRPLDPDDIHPQNTDGAVSVLRARSTHIGTGFPRYLSLPQVTAAIAEEADEDAVLHWPVARPAVPDTDPTALVVQPEQQIEADRWIILDIRRLLLPPPLLPLQVVPAPAALTPQILAEVVRENFPLLRA